MRQLTSIVARSSSGVIGVQNRLPWRVKSDLSFFRSTTLHNVVVMGRKTHDSLGGCLPKRRNVIVTHGFSLISEGPHCKTAGAIDESLCMAQAAAGRSKDVFIIGGASMYHQFAPFVDRYLVTVIEKDVVDGDTFFDMNMLGDLNAWRCKIVGEGKIDKSIGDDAAYRIYEYVAKDRSTITAHRQDVMETYAQRRKRSVDKWQSTGVCA